MRLYSVSKRPRDVAVGAGDPRNFEWGPERRNVCRAAQRGRSDMDRKFAAILFRCDIRGLQAISTTVTAVHKVQCHSDILGDVHSLSRSLDGA